MRKFVLKLTVVITILSASACSSQAEITRGPYVQNAEPDKITIMWRTAKPLKGSVFFGREKAKLRFEVGTTYVSKSHELTIGGLTPNRKYYYQVRTGETNSPIGSFWTAAEPDDEFRFAIFGDTRSAHKPHALVVENIIRHEPRFALHTGDLSNRLSDSEIVKFFQIEAALLRSIVLYPVMGNHDYRSGGKKMAELFSLPTNLTEREIYYSFNYGSAHFLVINSQDHGAYMADKLQRLAIEKDLKEASSNPDIKYIFVFMHLPMHSIGGAHGGCETPGLRNNLGPIFRQYGVNAVFHGHDHYYQRFEPDGDNRGLGDPPGEPDVIEKGVTYVVVGGGGAPLYHPKKAGTKEPKCGKEHGLTVKYALRDYSFLIIDLSAKKADFKLYNTKGEIKDQFIIMPGKASE